MNITDIKNIGREYDLMFDNLDEVAHLSFLFDPRFGELMQKAIARGSALTRAEVKQVFGDPGWEW